MTQPESLEDLFEQAVEAIPSARLLPGGDITRATSLVPCSLVYLSVKLVQHTPHGS